MANLQPHFEVSDDKGLSSRDESIAYHALLWCFVSRLASIKQHKNSSFYKDCHLTAYLVDSALYASTADTWTYDKSVGLIMPCRDLPPSETLRGTPLCSKEQLQILNPSIPSDLVVTSASLIPLTAP
jgi:hypothetical protein